MSYKKIIRIGTEKLGTIGIIGGSLNSSKIRVFDFDGNFIDENAELTLGQDRTNAGCAYLEQGPGGDPHVLIGILFLEESMLYFSQFSHILYFQLVETELPSQNCGT